MTNLDNGKFLVGTSTDINNEIIDSIKNNKNTILVFDNSNNEEYIIATRKIKLRYKIVNNRIELSTSKEFRKEIGINLEYCLNVIKLSQGYDDIYLNYKISYADVDVIYTEIDIDTVQRCLNIEFRCDIGHFGRIGLYRSSEKLINAINLFSDYLTKKDLIDFEESLNIMNLLFYQTGNVLYLEPDKIDIQLAPAMLDKDCIEDYKSQVNKFIDYIIEKLNINYIEYVILNESFRGITFNRERISRIYLYNSKKLIIDIKMVAGIQTIELEFNKSTFQDLVDLFGVNAFFRNDGKRIDTVLTNKRYMNNSKNTLVDVIAVSNNNISGKIVVYKENGIICHEPYETFISYIDPHENKRKFEII